MSIRKEARPHGSSMPTCTWRWGGIILAGGKSARMGTDKALLQIYGLSLLERTLSAFRLLTEQTIIVAERADSYHLPEVRVVGDLFPDCGPLGGIVTGLSAIDAEYCLVAACDMPALQTPLLALLQQKAAPEWDAVVPYRNGRPEPLCAVYRRSALPLLQASLDQGNRAMHEALRALRVLRIEEDELRRADSELRTFINLNTPQEAADFIARSGEND